MTDRIAVQLTEAMRKVYSSVDDQSKELEHRNKHSTILIAELDTQVHELAQTAMKLSESRHNAVLSVGLVRK